MNKREYAEYEAAVKDFFEAEGIANLTSGHIECPDCGSEWQDDGECPEGCGNRDCFNEPFFSRSPCDCCGTSLGGDREHATGWNPTTKEIQEYTICTDCVYYAEYGRLDDTTMLEVEGS
jgi:hypothetical protein